MKSLNRIITIVILSIVISSCLPPPPRPPRPPKPPRPPRPHHGMLEMKQSDKIAIYKIAHSLHNI